MSNTSENAKKRKTDTAAGETTPEDKKQRATEIVNEATEGGTEGAGKKKTLKEKWRGLSKKKKTAAKIAGAAGLLGIAGAVAYRNPLSSTDEKKEKDKGKGK